ncbi:MAG: hypothetical protein P8170_19685 [Gemmatimonadota bacterium]
MGQAVGDLLEALEVEVVLGVEGDGEDGCEEQEERWRADAS